MNDYTRQLLPVAGMIAFYNEKVDIFLDGRKLEGPKTHFFPYRPISPSAELRTT
jgi:hypothetical protein